MIGARRQGLRASRSDHRYGERDLADRGCHACRGKAAAIPVDHVSLSLRAGEIVGIYGLMGAGRTELFDCIMGQHRHARGRIFVDGKPIAGSGP